MGICGISSSLITHWLTERSLTIYKSIVVSGDDLHNVPPHPRTLREPTFFAAPEGGPPTAPCSECSGACVASLGGAGLANRSNAVNA